MDIKTYTEFTRKTAVYSKKHALDYLIPALAAEAGEVAGKWAKRKRGDSKYDTDAKLFPVLADELGDVMWMVVRIAEELGMSPEDIMQMNADKLSGRVERGTIRGDGDVR